MSHKSYEVHFSGYFTVLIAESIDEAREKFIDYFNDEFAEIDIDTIHKIEEID